MKGEAMNTNGNGNGHKRAILYARVSTDEQADKGYSLPSQFDAMRKYASAQGFEIVAEFQDDYSGATPIEHRPEGRKAYAMLQTGSADAIIAYTIDRYVRPPEDGDEWEMPILIRGLAKLGKEIHTVRRGKLNTGFADLLIALLDARKAGEERRDIRERSMRGKRQKAKEGKVIGYRAPFGYRQVKDQNGRAVTLEIDETTGRIVRIIYQWYVIGDETGKPLATRAIALRLSEMGIATPGELQRGYKHRKRKPCMWGANTVIQILEREAYAGIWRFGLYEKTGRGETYKKGNGANAIAVNVPAIIDRDLWERAQARRKYNAEISKRNCKHDYLLRGMIRCGICESAMTGHFITTPPNLYYQCGQFYARHKLERRCDARTVRADAIEADVWDEICELFQDLDRLWADLKAAQQNEEDKLKPIRDKLQTVEDFIKHAERDISDIAMAMRAARGRIVAEFEKQQDEANARLDSLFVQREKLIAELGARKLTDENIESIIDYARDVRAGIDGADFDRKRRTLESLGVEVKIKEGRYFIKCVIAETEGEIRITDRRRKGAPIVSHKSLPDH